MKRYEGEQEESYIVRVCSNKESFGLSWKQIATALNEKLGYDYGESRYRKLYQNYIRLAEALKSTIEDETTQRYEEMRIEAEKEKIKLRTERTKYNKLIRERAKNEGVRELIEDTLSSADHLPKLERHKIARVGGNRHGMVIASDWHYGITIDNQFNKFNKEIFEQRVQKLVYKVIKYGKENRISTLHFANLGDMISGNLHTSLMIQNTQDNVIGQIKFVSETLSQVLATLANEFDKVVYYNVIGNHGRALQKNEAAIADNYEYLLPFYIEARLKDFSNIEFVSDKEGFIETEVLGEFIVLVHGNFDAKRKSYDKLPQLLGYVPNMIVQGHIHTRTNHDYGTTNVITNGSLCGLDDHSLQGRYSGTPKQMFLLFDEEGHEATYEIKL